MNPLVMAAAFARDGRFKPGNKLIAGSAALGYYGEIPATDFISATELATILSLGAGVSRNANEPWLKFAHNGNTLYVAKKVCRTSLSWDNINACGAVFGKSITFGGKSYIVRLLTGIPGTEFDTLLGRVHAAGTMPDKFANFTAAELDMGSIYTLCQETVMHPTFRVGRHNIPSSMTTLGQSESQSHCGWRPVLQLVE